MCPTRKTSTASSKLDSLIKQVGKLAAQVTSNKIDTLVVQVDHLQDLIFFLIKKETDMSASFDDLAAQVARNSDVSASGVAVIHDLADRITALGDAPTPEAIQALADSVHAAADNLGAAIATVPPRV